MKIVIEGAGEVGSHLAKMLRAEANEVTVIDSDEGRLSALAAYADVGTVHGNPSSITVLRQAGVAKADLFIAVYPNINQEVNVVGALLAKRLGAAKVIARVNDEDYFTAENKLLFKEMGIDLMFYPEKSAAEEIIATLKHSSSAETMGFARGKLQIAIFKLDEDSPMLDLKLKDFVEMVKPEELQQFRVIAISREDKTIIPKLDTKFHFGDLVFTVSLQEGVQPLFKYFGKEDIKTRSVMIMGGTAIAEMVAKSLVKQNVDVKIIDKNKERCIELSERLPSTVAIINGDGRNSDVLFDEGISSYDAFIALTNRDENNVLACVVAKKLDNVINKKMVTAGRIFRFTLSGKARFVRYMSGTNTEVIEYTVAPGAPITKCKIRDLDFPTNAIICGVIRGQESLIAVGNTQIEAYDKVAIFALQESVREIDRFFR